MVTRRSDFKLAMEGGGSRVKLSMLTFISPNVSPKWSNSSKSTTKMTKQSFGPLKRLEQKNNKIVPKTDDLPNVPPQAH
jgi:hypothetical protein